MFFQKTLREIWILSSKFQFKMNFQEYDIHFNKKKKIQIKVILNIVNGAKYQLETWNLIETKVEWCFS